MNTELHVVTIATHKDGYYDALIESGKRNNIDIKTLGWGQKWKGFTMKYELLNKYLDSIPEDDIVIFVDAYDVILLETKDEILNRFYSYQSPIVLSVEIPPEIPIIQYLYNKIFAKCENYNINSGLYIGYAWALKRLYSIICQNGKCEKDNIDDQVLLIDVCNNKNFFNKYIEVDEQRKIFCNTIGHTENYQNVLNIEDEFEAENGKLYFKNKNYGPCFVHGPNNTNLDSIVNFYNLPKGKAETRDLIYKVKLFSKPFYHKYYMQDIVVFFCILVIIFGFIEYNKNKK